MSNKHDTPQNRCPYCLKLFWTAKGLKFHLQATGHSQFIGDQQSDQARKKLQHYHQDKVTSR